MITDIDVIDFISKKGSEIEIGECDKNAYLFYEAFKGRGVSIRIGTADAYRNGIRIGTYDHFWNIIDAADGVGDRIVDVYSLKPDGELEYRHHRDGRPMPGDELKRLIDSRPILRAPTKSIRDDWK